MSPGQLVVFLSDGTLVFASSFATPALGTWSFDGESLTMVEDGIPYEVEIFALTETAFEIRSHNPGGFVDTRFVPAETSALPDSVPVQEASRTSEVLTVFRVPASRPGQLVLDEGQLRFRECGRVGAGTIVEDVENEEGKRILREFGSRPDGVTVLVRLEGNQLREIRYAGLEGPDCSSLPPQGQVEARGNEPFWLLRVEGDEALFITPEMPDGLEYEDGAWSRPAEHYWRYDAERARDDQTESLTLEIIEERCGDSMSGARYPFRAVVYRNGERLEGCALEGVEAYAAAPAN